MIRVVFAQFYFARFFQTAFCATLINQIAKTRHSQYFIRKIISCDQIGSALHHRMNDKISTRVKEREMQFYLIKWNTRFAIWWNLAAFALPKSHLPRERTLPASFYTLCPALAPSSPSSIPPLHEPYLARAYLWRLLLSPSTPSVSLCLSPLSLWPPLFPLDNRGDVRLFKSSYALMILIMPASREDRPS